ncbi:MAG: GTP cyclohydrolase I FolE2 [Methanomassiliicoccales archaeon]|nr:MAG: GTP cyclohydrolase I FolE2 [Methanomassiliicoccales archaeon]
MTRVGVTGVRKPVQVQRPDKAVTLNIVVDAFVDLPSNMKGSHLSRNVEVIGEIVDESVREPVSSIENLTLLICRSLLERHEYASLSEARTIADYFLERKTPMGKKSLEGYKIFACAKVRRGDGLTAERRIGVEVVGMTACPCAMETIKDSLSVQVENLPIITHNQRNKTTIEMDVPNGFEIEADDLIEMVENAMSSPTYEILKREDEAEVVRRAHDNPKFVEDVVRDILSSILDKYADFPDDVAVRVRSESEESIHKHNAFAERDTTFRELRL